MLYCIFIQLQQTNSTRRHFFLEVCIRTSVRPRGTTNNNFRAMADDDSSDDGDLFSISVQNRSSSFTLQTKNSMDSDTPSWATTDEPKSSSTTGENDSGGDWIASKRRHKGSTLIHR